MPVLAVSWVLIFLAVEVSVDHDGVCGFSESLFFGWSEAQEKYISYWSLEDGENNVKLASGSCNYKYIERIKWPINKINLNIFSSRKYAIMIAYSN